MHAEAAAVRAIDSESSDPSAASADNAAIGSATADIKRQAAASNIQVGIS